MKGEGGSVAKGVDNIKFLVAYGTVNLAGQGQVFRECISIQEHRARDQKHNDVFQGESDGS